MTGALVAQSTAPLAADPAPAPNPSPAPAPAPPSPLHRWGMDFTFTLDGYTDKNFNNPPSKLNGLRNFDFRNNGAYFSYGQITIDRAPAPVGFRLDIGAGKMFDFLHSFDRASQTAEGLKYFKQAYIAFKPKSLKGVQVDAGKFVTSAGAELIDTPLNWNYSRSLLFAWANPYFHFGLRTSFPVGEHFTGGVQLVQGWNNIYDNNKGKTLGLTGSYNWKKATWSNAYYVGQEKTAMSGVRHLYDTVILVNPTDKISTAINFDYAQDKIPGAGTAKWAGIAASARFALGSKAAFSPRVEYFKDMDGFSTGTAQALKEITLTGEYKLAPWLISRLEFRNDWSDVEFFEKKNGLGKSQATVLLGLMVYLK
jgi:putative OmpL-like beta-barrel porin-2